MQFEVDTTEARKKLAGLAGLGKAYRWSLAKWASLVVQHIKQSRSRFFKTSPSGQLMRNVSFRHVVSSEENPKVAIGTGLSGSIKTVYADIQDRGGTIRPKNKQWLTVPLPGVKGRAANFPDAFIIKSKKGNLLIVQRSWKKVRGGENYQGAGLQPLFVLKKEVTLPATGWFSTPIEEMTDLLHHMLSPDEILRVLPKQISIGGE